jgi:hypothetical protein
MIAKKRSPLGLGSSSGGVAHRSVAYVQIWLTVSNGHRSNLQFELVIRLQSAQGRNVLTTNFPRFRGIVH